MMSSRLVSRQTKSMSTPLRCLPVLLHALSLKSRTTDPQLPPPRQSPLRLAARIAARLHSWVQFRGTVWVRVAIFPTANTLRQIWYAMFQHLPRQLKHLLDPESFQQPLQKSSLTIKQLLLKHSRFLVRFPLGHRVRVVSVKTRAKAIFVTTTYQRSSPCSRVSTCLSNGMSLPACRTGHSLISQCGCATSVLILPRAIA